MSTLGAPPRVGRVRLDGGQEVDLLEAGDRAALRAPAVFLHGLGRSTEDWRAVFERLGGARSLVALDLRALRDEGPPAHPERQGELVGALVDTLGLPPVVLVGHSYGGHVALAVA